MHYLELKTRNFGQAFLKHFSDILKISTTAFLVRKFSIINQNYIKIKSIIGKGSLTICTTTDFEDKAIVVITVKITI